IVAMKRIDAARLVIILDLGIRLEIIGRIGFRANVETDPQGFVSGDLTFPGPPFQEGQASNIMTRSALPPLRPDRNRRSHPCASLTLFIPQRPRGIDHRRTNGMIADD